MSTLRTALRASIFGLGFAVLLGTENSALAQSSASEKAMASQLFDEAKQLIKAGKFGDACPKLAESERLDPQLGTLLHLANCYEKVGKTASAWALFREAAALAEQRGDKREALAKSRRAALEANLSKVKLDVPPNAPSGLEIQQDETTIGSAVWSLAMAMDPGPHKIRVRAPGFKEWSSTITVPNGPHLMQVAIPSLEPEPEPVTTKPATSAQEPTLETKGESGATVTPPGRSPALPPDELPKTHENPSSWQRPTGFVIGGIGVVGLGIGGVFLVRRQSMIAERDDARACLSMPGGCTDVQKLQISRSEKVVKNDGTVAYTGFIAGGALIVTGLVFVLTAPSSTPSSARSVDLTPWAFSDRAGLTLSGRW